MSVGGIDLFHEAYGPLLFPTIPGPSFYCYRCPLKLTYPSCGVACAQDVEDVIRTTTSGKIAAVMAEPSQGVGGFSTPPEE